MPFSLLTLISPRSVPLSRRAGATLDVLVRAVALVALLWVCTASAEELVGTPVPVGDTTSRPSAVDHQPAPVAPAAPTAPEPGGTQPAGHWAPSIQPPFAGNESITFSDEQVDRLFEEHIGPEISRALREVDGKTLSSAIVVPFIFFFFVFGCPILLLLLLLVLRYRAKARHLHHVNLNIDKLLAAGRDIPLELLRGDDPLDPTENYLHKGMMNIGIGVGFFVFFTLLVGVDVAAAGFILIGMGISRVLIWKLSQPKTTTETVNRD